ncbi:MAG: CmcJ/NvfI family oxidoreductase [Novosphingobium sp.]
MTDSITAKIAYASRLGGRQRYYANDHSRDTVVVDLQPMPIVDARDLGTRLDSDGFELAAHCSAVRDFEDLGEVAEVHRAEIAALLREVTGADEVLVTAPGIVRYSEVCGKAGTRDNSYPARFAHIDATAQTSAGFAAGALPDGRKTGRFAHYNVWRSFSGAPQDVPLALCAAGSVAEQDLLIADAVFDAPGKPHWSFESWLLAHNPGHRWHWFPDMTRDEVIIFKSSDSVHFNPVPHVAFDCPAWPTALVPRVSIEMRALAFWYA